MSLHEIFDAIWNYPVPWLWVIGLFIGGWVVFLGLVALVVGMINKEGKNAPKP